MQTAEFNYQDFQGNRNEADKTLLVKFFIKPRKDRQASLKEGRPIFRDTEYIDIKIPGNRTAGVCRPASKQDKERFPEHYARFKQRIENAPEEGTPLSEWPVISRSQAEELAFFHVKTVEQLANMADVQASKFLGLLEVKHKAQEWLKQANKAVSESKLKKELDDMRAENEALRKELMNAVKTMKEQNEAEDKKRRRSRAARAALREGTDARNNDDNSE